MTRIFRRSLVFPPLPPRLTHICYLRLPGNLTNAVCVQLGRVDSQARFQGNSCTHLPSTCGGPASVRNFPPNVYSQPGWTSDPAFRVRLQAARTGPTSATGESNIHPTHPRRQFQQKWKLGSPNHSLHYHCPVGVLRLLEPTGQAVHLGPDCGRLVQRNPS